MTRPRLLFATACITAALAACGRGQPAPTSPAILGDNAVTIGAFDFPESELLARLYGMAVSDAGFEVDLQLALGPRELVEPALERGLIELLPEYAGSALGFLTGGRGRRTVRTRPTMPWSPLRVTAGSSRWTPRGPKTRTGSSSRLRPPGCTGSRR